MYVQGNHMKRGVKVTGIRQEIMKIRGDIEAHRQKLYKAGQRVAADWERQAKDRAPVLEGTLRDSGSGNIRDNGYGNGFTLSCTFDTPYARRRHEGKYQARTRDQYDRKRSKKTGRYYYSLKKEYRGMRTGSGLIVGSKGVLIGRKYISRAWVDNRRKYEKSLQAAVK